MSSPRTVLIISPRFPPTNAADHQRVRMTLPYFRELGWEPVVVAVEAEEVAAVQDPRLCYTYPEDITVHRVPARSLRFWRRLGVGSLTFRAMPFLRRKVLELCQSKPPALIFFSTTEFGTIRLGQELRRRFGIPYLVDLQDPWVNRYYHDNGVRPPGGWMKYRLIHALARRQEPGALREAAHIIAVSAAYPRQIRERYPDIPGERFTVIPFAANENDFALLEREPVEQRVFDRTDGLLHWTYAGRGGADMAFALRGFFRAFAEWVRREPATAGRIRMHFVGTSYATGGRALPTIQPVAEEMGVAHQVDERPERIPYFETIQTLKESDALIVPGSSDAGYTASKIYPYVLARRPLLAIFNEGSSVVSFLEGNGLGTVAAFSADDSEESLAGRIADCWFDSGSFQHVPEGNPGALEAFSARKQASDLAAIFNRVADLGGNGRGSPLGVGKEATDAIA